MFERAMPFYIRALLLWRGHMYTLYSRYSACHCSGRCIVMIRLHSVVNTTIKGLIPCMHFSVDTPACFTCKFHAQGGWISVWHLLVSARSSALFTFITEARGSFHKIFHCFNGSFHHFHGSIRHFHGNGWKLPRNLR